MSWVLCWLVIARPANAGHNPAASRCPIRSEQASQCRSHLYTLPGYETGQGWTSQALCSPYMAFIRDLRGGQGTGLIRPKASLGMKGPVNIIGFR